MSMENIFGVEENADESATAVMDDFVLDLSDEDLDNSSSQYVPIPAGTTTNFLIYEVDTSRSQAGNPQWKLTLRAEEDTWGANKQIRQTITFSPKNPFIWGPFLKGVGMVEGSGSVNLAKLDPQSLVGKTVQARVLGYTWKDGVGSYQRSFGKGKQAVPNDGTTYYEELGNWSAPAKDESDELGGLGEFSSDSYL